VRDYYAGGYEIGRRVVESHGQRPEALFVYNDTAALGFEKAVMEAGLHVPQDIALVGFDNIEQGEYAAVPLTTIQQPTVRIGAEAVDVLIRKIEGREAQTRTVFMPGLVIRDSCGYRAVGTRAAGRAGTFSNKLPQETTLEW